MDRPSTTIPVPGLKPLADCRLYAFVDTAYLEGRNPCHIAAALCSGGADIIQLRAKAESSTAIRHMAEQLLQVTRPAGVWLIINDHVDAAVAVGAPGCHLGQEDFAAKGKRELAALHTSGTRLSFGLSTHAPGQALSAVAAGAHYLGIGPVFPTPTKPNASAVGLDYVRWAARSIHIPWFAIGGISMDNVDTVLEAGARRICVVSAILRATDVAAACRGFRRKLTN